MQWWKQYPPGWLVWDRWFDGSDGDGGGDGGDGGGDDSGGDGGGDGGDGGGDGGDGGGGGNDGGSDGSDSGGFDSGGGGGGFGESDGDAGDNGAVQREWANEQRQQEQDFEQERQQNEQDRNDRAAQDMERERQRQEDERRRQEEERQRAEAEAERQRQVAEQQRLAEAYRLQQSQQNGVAYGTPPPSPDGGIPVPRPEDAFYRQPIGDTPVLADPQPTPPSESVILRHKVSGMESRLSRDQLQYVTNLDEFDVRDDTASSPLQLEPSQKPPETPPEPPKNVEPFTRTATGLIQDILDQNPATPTPSTGAASSIPPGQLVLPPDEQKPAPPPPERAAQNAAAATAATGAPAETVAATAELAARIASDQQTLDQQSGWTRAMFRGEYGDRADQEWVRQHEAELTRNMRLYGSREPSAGSVPLAGSPVGTLAAPNRQIGATPPPAYGETAQYGLPAQRAAAGVTPPGAPAAARGNALGLGAIGSQPAPTGAAPAVTAPALATGAPAASGWTPLPGQGPPRVATAPTALAPRTTTSVPVPPGGLFSPQETPYINAGASATAPPKPGEPGGIPLTTEHGVLPPTPASNLVSAIGPDDREYIFTADEWGQQDPEVKNQYREAKFLTLAANGQPISPQQQGDTGPAPTSLPTPAIVTTIPQAVASNSPIDALASMALVGRGENATTATVQRDSYNIAQGISALLSGTIGSDGKPTGAWTEPYLNDVARLAWTKEEAQNGRQSDPRDAPVDYIEHWKDAFYGGGGRGDEQVPLVKELNQQMLDYAATRTPAGQPFRWQDAYGPNGEKGLISHQVTEIDCGPNAFSTIMRSRGYNNDPREAYAFALAHRYHDGNQFTGPDNMVNMLNKEAGLQATSVAIDPSGKNWDQIDKELAEGRPVMLSSPGHYWVVSAKDPATGKYYAGATTLRGNPEWMPPGGFRYGGDANRAIFTRGDVDPTSPAVREMNLKPPATVPRDTRAFLSANTIQASEESPATSSKQPAPVAQSGIARRSGGTYSYPGASVQSSQGEGSPDTVVRMSSQEEGVLPGDQTGYGGSPSATQMTYPLADDPRNRAAVSENVWSPRQPARQGLMVDYQQLPYADREVAFDRAMDEGLAAENITGDDAARWKRAMYEIATGTGRLKGVPGENPALNPYMIAGESDGTPSTAKVSSATGYFQMIQTNRDGSDFAFLGYVPKEYNGDVYNPVAQVRQVIRAINASSNFRGNPDAAVADKQRKGHWDLVVQRTAPW